MQVQERDRVRRLGGRAYRYKDCAGGHQGTAARCGGIQAWRLGGGAQGWGRWGKNSHCFAPVAVTSGGIANSPPPLPTGSRQVGEE